MNDTLRTNVFVKFTPETIACACIFLAARQLQVIVATLSLCLSAHHLLSLLLSYTSDRTAPAATVVATV